MELQAPHLHLPLGLWVIRKNMKVLHFVTMYLFDKRGKILGPVTYYRALACYDPQFQSPNEDAAEEELGFLENDILIVSEM